MVAGLDAGNSPLVMRGGCVMKRGMRNAVPAFREPFFVLPCPSLFCSDPLLPCCFCCRRFLFLRRLLRLRLLRLRHRWPANPIRPRRWCASI